MGVLINVGSIMGKEILNLAEGTMIGKVCGVALTPDLKVAGLKVREKRFMGNVNVVPFENVKAFGATVTVNGLEGAACADIREALGKNVITADGNLLGRVEELAFDSESGQVAEIVIKGELMDTLLGGRGILPGEKLLSFGKDVVVAAEGVLPEDLHVPAEEFYGDWKAVDEVLNEIDGQDGDKAEGQEEAAGAQEEVSFAEDEDGAESAEEATAEKVERVLEGLSKSMEEAFNKIKDEVTSEKFKEQTDRFVDRFGEETKNLFNDIRLWVKSIDTESLKEDIKSRINCREEPEDVLAADLVEQLKDLTVEKPVLDEEGNVIVWPGQIIGKEEIKTALRSGKLQDLLDLATVSLLHDDAGASAAQEDAAEAEEAVAEEAAAEEAPVEEAPLSEEDAAFIAEEAAKMEQAEEKPEA